MQTVIHAHTQTHTHISSVHVSHKLYHDQKWTHQGYATAVYVCWPSMVRWHAHKYWNVLIANLSSEFNGWNPNCFFSPSLWDPMMRVIHYSMTSTEHVKVHCVIQVLSKPVKTCLSMYSSAHTHLAHSTCTIAWAVLKVYIRTYMWLLAHMHMWTPMSKGGITDAVKIQQLIIGEAVKWVQKFFQCMSVHLEVCGKQYS